MVESIVQSRYGCILLDICAMKDASTLTEYVLDVTSKPKDIWRGVAHVGQMIQVTEDNEFLISIDTTDRIVNGTEFISGWWFFREKFNDCHFLALNERFQIHKQLHANVVQVLEIVLE